ncbi:TPM domain-containing protein [Pseudonocardia broussonetiae]|uniref:TPM domain-containing protein n=1 Tax=Pseudonocardia broussonetiae TaxID=2736640 RepID=A0A6M6JGH5_9PSEU|nr:TPM domain-containing protein [Pseudonocardia broussonetiae]QJY45832.1 TPM domain-containing protein [Pseudonocardia broussonetiae]
MRRLPLLAVVLGLFALIGAGVAAAEPPSRVGPAVTDSAGVLAPGDQARITEAFGRLREANGTQLFVVYVDSFDGADGQSWADESARLSQFGAQDVLLAVAVGDRAYGVSVADGLTVGESTVDSAIGDAEDRLAQDDWAGAAIALSDGLGGGGSGGFPVGALLLGGVVVVGGGAYVVSRRRRNRTAAVPADPAQPPAPRDEFSDVATDDLAYRASAGLIEVDEAVRTSEIELSAARGHFGEEAVRGFAAAVEASKADMLRAFGVRQQLDDDVPEDEPTQRRMHADIIRACRAADERLDAQVAAFDAMRNLEATAPEYVAGLAARRDAVLARVPQTGSTWQALSARYAPSALEPVAGSLAQARRLLDVAGTEITAARSEVDAGARPAAVVSGRAAEDALTQAETLLDAVPRRGTELVEAAAAIPAARAETEQDLAEARALDASLAPVVARAEAAVTASEQVEAGDPIAALRLLDEAGAALDEAIAAARVEQDRRRRTAAVLEQTLLTARSAVDAAEDFVTTHRGAVDATARTRLAEAKRHLENARNGQDPAEALREAQQADSLAQEALRLAQSDASSWSSTSSGSTGVDLGSLILGGIISGATRGGGGGWSSGGGGGWSSGGGGGFSPGSFGGSASRGRRGGGGRF